MLKIEGGNAACLTPRLREVCAENQYQYPKEVARNGEAQIAALHRYMFTWGLVTGITETGWSERWCYEREGDAISALAQWDGSGDPPGPWIKHKGRGGEYLGPGATE